jgi:hypothetical protein
MSQLVFNTAIIEEEIKFEQSPGSNGETEFYNVVRLMLPSVNGISVSDLLNEGEMFFEFEEMILSNWNPAELNTVVYLQNKITKEIYQAGSTFK